MKTRKLFAILLAVVLTFSLGVSALAAQAAPGTITINAPTGKVLTDRTFEAYLLASITDVYGTTPDIHYNYAATELLKTAVDTLDPGKTTNQQYIEYIVAQTSTTQRATLAATIEAIATAGSGIDVEVDSTGTFAMANNVAPGYYIVIETTDEEVLKDKYPGASRMVSAIDTVEAGTNFNITIKSTFADFEKTVRTVDGAEITDASRNYKIGDEVFYQLDAQTPAITAATTAATYNFTDTMGAGLTFNENVEISIDSIVVDNDNVAVTLQYNATNDGFTLDIDFLKFATPYEGGLDIVITYSANINEEALAIVGNPLDNKATLEYSNMPDGGKLTETVPVYTYGFEFAKVNSDEDTPLPLIGAEFELYAVDPKNNDSAKALTFTYSDGIYYYDEAAATATITSTDNLFKIFGLDAGDYYLVETKAPEGFNLLVDPVIVTLTAAAVVQDVDYTGGWTVTVGTATPIAYTSRVVFLESDTASVGFNVVNVSGIELPSTGGIGTTLFTILGSVTVLSAGLFLALNKKRVFGK